MTIKLTPTRVAILFIVVIALIIGLDAFGTMYWDWRDNVDALSQ